MSGRDIVLNRLADALDRPAAVRLDDQPAQVRDRIHAASRHTLPKVADDLITTLIKNMESVLMSVVRLQSIDNCQAAVEDYLETHAIDVSVNGAVRVSPALAEVPWPTHYEYGAATGEEKVSITPCMAAVAETGSIVTMSGADTPATLNFLPETHIIILHESQLVRHVDDVFPFLRSLDILPRAVNFITGPSRTADIEQTLEIGAHGPRRMHVLLLPDPH